MLTIIALLILKFVIRTQVLSNLLALIWLERRDNLVVLLVHLFMQPESSRWIKRAAQNLISLLIILLHNWERRRVLLTLFVLICFANLSWFLLFILLFERLIYILFFVCEQLVDMNWFILLEKVVLLPDLDFIKEVTLGSFLSAEGKPAVH